MMGMKIEMRVVAVVLLCLGMGGKRGVGEVEHDHVVGGDKGWAPSDHLLSWATARVFRVGDNIWFAYSATEGNIMELQTWEEFHTCDLSNPIRMYTNGLDKVSLHSEGFRFFTSSNLDHCRNGLKLRVNVQPQVYNETLTLEAAGPASPSASAHLTAGLSLTLFVALALSYMGLQSNPDSSYSACLLF